MARAVTDLDRLRRDSGLSIRRWAAFADVDAGYASQILAGEREPSIAVLVALAAALGSKLSVRAIPSTGPHVFDGVQARIVEELLRIADPTWDKAVEVPVQRPARGFVDVVFDSAVRQVMVATEVESRIDRVEQELRWVHDKALSLPSSDLWQYAPGDRSISRLLVLRSTATMRELARRFASTFRVAYPARAREIHAALTTSQGPWPGPGILWADVHGDVVRILDRPPRGVALGR